MAASVQDMLKSGVHFGHQTKRWHPKMKQFIFTARSGVHIIDLEKTQAKLTEACDVVRNMAKEGKTLLFVGTKRQAKEIIKAAAESARQPYLTERWIGGFLTNFPTVSKLMERLRKLKKDKASGELLKYKKHEQMQFDEEIERLTFLVGGVENVMRVPDALFIVDIMKESTAVKEALKVGIPIIAIVDSNTNPDLVTYPIPANDDATKSVELITKEIASAYAQGSTEGKKDEAPVAA